MSEMDDLKAAQAQVLQDVADETAELADVAKRLTALSGQVSIKSQ